MNRTALIVLTAAAGLAAAPAALAGPVYNFTRITNNGPVDVASQLTVEVEPAAKNRVDFIFRNAGPVPSSITDIYFQSGPLASIASIINGDGVLFVPGASPPNLPGGNGIGFAATLGLNAQSAPPAQPMGVNPGETVTIRFNLLDGMTYGDTIDALNLGALTGGDNPNALRIGLHVQGIGTGWSDSFVNVTTIPLPSAASLAAIGLTMAARRRRR